MFLIFLATFKLGSYPSDWLQSGMERLSGLLAGLWSPGSESPLKSLLLDGVIAGVGNVIAFLPSILILFLAIGVLEDSGYMPRAAFLMDRIMHKIGLHGKSFIPLLLGFGCSVPAIMATRTLETRRDRLTTMLIAPLMSCGARLPIYALIIPAFFQQTWQAPMLWLIYVIGIVAAIVSAKLLRSTLFRGEASPFVMELPPYRIPMLRDVLLHTWERSELYLKKAGTIILALSITLWALTNYPKPPKGTWERTAAIAANNGAPVLGTAALQGTARLPINDEIRQEREEKAFDLSYSCAGRIGRFLAPVVAPMGFDWKIGTALIGALAAKEVFVSQMGIVYSSSSGEDEDKTPLRERLRQSYSPLVGFCIMLYCLLSAPCMATFAVTRRESGQWRWALLQFGGLTALAYVVTTVVFQVGRVLL
jgi:ferrous iron transport protein B